MLGTEFTAIQGLLLAAMATTASCSFLDALNMPQPQASSPATTRTADPDPDPDPGLAEPEAKRRKVRKGTRSCWECKRRKVRCNFVSDQDSVCSGCRHRGTKCQSQEYPEEPSAPADRSRQMGDRIVRVEALVEQLVKTVSTNKQAAPPLEAGIPTPSSSSSELPQTSSLHDSSPGKTPCNDEGEAWRTINPLETFRILVDGSSSRYEAISEALFAAFPSPGDLRILRENEAGGVVCFNQMVTTPLSVLETAGLKTSDAWCRMPDRNLHPVLIAKHMMMLATTMQSIYPFNHSTVDGLSEPPLVIARRMADAARTLVTNNDQFIGTVESLQCMLFEGMYQSNWGNLRRAWLAFRRAMVVAQLMGIHKPHTHQTLKVIDSETKIYPQYLWYRVVFADRFLSLMLGLSQGTRDNSFASAAQLAGDSPSGRLERIHCALASRILERNEADPSEDNFAEARAIDAELQKAANLIPGKWWLTPNLNKSTGDPREMFWEGLRLSKQLFHYYLLCQLHLPYMLQSDNQTLPSKDSKRANFEYSKATCVAASREILSRFVVYRSTFRVAFCCRNIDFFALMAAMTLLLAYLDCHRRRSSENMLAHQRASDRAMMEEVLENMECVSRLNDDVLSDKCSNVLRRLLVLEEIAAEGDNRASGQLDDGIQNAIRFVVPYFGTIKIDAAGNISRVGAGPQQTHPSAATNVPSDPSTTEQTTTGTAARQDPLWLAGQPAEDDTSEVLLPSMEGAEAAVRAIELGVIANDGLVPPPPPPVPGSSLAPFEAMEGNVTMLEYPPLAAGIDDWAFQGVDQAFFEQLMRGNVMPEAEDWGTWRV